MGIGRPQFRCRRCLWLDGEPHANDGRAIDRSSWRSRASTPQRSKPASRPTSPGRNSCAGDTRQACRSRDKDILTAMESKSERTPSAMTTPCARSCCWFRPDRRTPSSMDASVKRRPCAVAFRAARKESRSPAALKDVAVRDQIIRSSADIPAELRKVLDGIEVGRLTPPEVTKLGVEMFAICAKKESAADNTPGKTPGPREHDGPALRTAIQAVSRRVTSRGDARIQVKAERAMRDRLWR